MLKVEGNIEKIEKIVAKFLSEDHVHQGKKLIEIKNDTISTYDGQYPSFELIYSPEGNNLWLRQLRGEIIKSIQDYTGLRHNTHFWLGVSVEQLR